MPDQALDLIVIALIDLLKSRAAFGIGTGSAEFNMHKKS
jgi:hypothetical protein